MASALVQLRILNSGSMWKGKGKGDVERSGSGKVEKRRQGVVIMANYLVSLALP